MSKLALWLIALAVLVGYGVGTVEAQSIGVGDAKITLPIIITLAPEGNGLSGMAAHFSISGEGTITCIEGVEADFNQCDSMQTVRLAVSDNLNIWGSGDQANIGSITVSGISGETKIVWLTVIDSDDDNGLDTTRNYAPAVIQVTIP